MCSIDNSLRIDGNHYRFVCAKVRSFIRLGVGLHRFASVGFGWASVGRLDVARQPRGRYLPSLGVECGLVNLGAVVDGLLIDRHEFAAGLQHGFAWCGNLHFQLASVIWLCQRLMRRRYAGERITWMSSRRRGRRGGDGGDARVRAEFSTRGDFCHTPTPAAPPGAPRSSR